MAYLAVVGLDDGAGLFQVLLRVALALNIAPAEVALYVGVLAFPFLDETF